MTDNYTRDLEKENERLRSEALHGEQVRATLVQELDFARARLESLGRESEEARDIAKRMERERDEARLRAEDAAAHLYGHASFIGPCPHGRDPWTRCDTCANGNAVRVALALRDQEKTVREHVEKERDAAREAADDWKTCSESEKAARERAEADCAAMREALSDSCSGQRALDWVDALLVKVDLGSALLERLRAAEAVVEAARGYCDRYRADVGREDVERAIAACDAARNA